MNKNEIVLSSETCDYCRLLACLRRKVAALEGASAFEAAILADEISAAAGEIMSFAIHRYEAVTSAAEIICEEGK